MSATVVREKRQVTIPEDVSDAAGIKIGDQIDWRFEAGELRAKILVPAQVPTVRPVRVKGRLRPPPGFRPSASTIAAAVRADRDSR